MGDWWADVWLPHRSTSYKSNQNGSHQSTCFPWQFRSGMLPRRSLTGV